MVLVDTSIWIRTLRGREPFVAEMDRLTDNDNVASHEMVLGELLIGDSGGRSGFLAYYERFDRAITVPHDEAVLLTRVRKLYGRGLSWIDVHLLASALAGGHQLYTADQALIEAAAELGVAYVPKTHK